MSQTGPRRIESHPILPVPAPAPVPFRWRGRELAGQAGEPIASALIANGIAVFGHHRRDGQPLGIYCANGQCAQCTVIAGGEAVKACMEPLAPGMEIWPCEELPHLPEAAPGGRFGPIETLEPEVLVVGGGPAGLSAALELGRLGVSTLLLDDKDRLGGKLVLQTHKFFGSIEDCRAGTRGIDIAAILAGELAALPAVAVRLQTTLLAVYADGVAGAVQGRRYFQVRPRVVLVATGAREKSLLFPGHHLPGVTGAGAFQTLVNRDLVRASERVLIVGGGNVGLIAGYHAIQAGMRVVALVEALPRVGGYQVHADKLARLGVPILTSHTVVRADGEERLERVTVAQVDERFRPMPGTAREYAVDTLLIAVGLTPVDEFAEQARQAGLPLVAAGDAREIAEASSAVFYGRIAGIEAARLVGRDLPPTPPEWAAKGDQLKSPPGRTRPAAPPPAGRAVYPVLHCVQEIPCNPCTGVCPKAAIRIEGDPLLGLPVFDGECTGCERCVAICPGLAITLVDRRADPEQPLVTVPLELADDAVRPGDRAAAVDREGKLLGRLEVVKVAQPRAFDRTRHVKLRAPADLADRIAGIRRQDPEAPAGTSPDPAPGLADETLVCRCEHVTVGEVRRLLRAGVRDLNEIKAATRAGMGACGGKGCPSLIPLILREEGIPLAEIVPQTVRPPFMEVPLGSFAGAADEPGGQALE